MESIGDRIKKRRTQLNMTQEELAKKINGITYAAVSNWENGRTVPNAKNSLELSLVLHCSMDWLLYGGVFSETIQNADKNVTIKIFDDYEFINGIQKQSTPIIISNRIDISKHSFGYVIKDNSMLPEFHESDIVILDPEITPKTDGFVLVRISDNILFRKYIINERKDNGVKFSLLPFSSDYLTISSSDYEIHILGVMVEHRIFRSKR